MELLRLDKITLLDLLSPLGALFGEVDQVRAAAVVPPAALDVRALDVRALYCELGPAIRRIGLYRGKVAPADGDDFVNDVFRRVCEKHQSFRGESTPQVWVLGIAYNVARNTSKRRRTISDPNVECDSLPTRNGLSPEERAMRGEAEAQLALVVDRLSEGEQRLFVTYWSTECVESAARVCGISPKKASHQLGLVRERVAKLLAQLRREHGWSKR